MTARAHAIRVLLVDDQAIIGEAVRRMLLATPEIEFHYCADPTKALQVATDVSPTVILQDLVMPQMDGMALLRAFREDAATRDVPMIVLSTKEEPAIKAEAFERGANDYLVKLPNVVELVARIRHHSAGYIAQIERNEAYEALKRSERKLARELGQAASYVASLLPEKLTAGDVRTDWHFIPSVQLGGDSFGYHWIDPDHFALYLLDVCGHGVKAALLSVSAMNAIRTQTLPATDFRDPGQVLGAVNEAFDMEKHGGMYFTMWYGVFSRTTRELRFSSAGHPPAAMISGSAGSATAATLQENGPVVGAFSGVAFETASASVPRGGRVYVFSDGVYEVSRPDGSMWTFEEFIGELKQRAFADGAVPSVIEAVRAVRGGDEFEDDVSLVEVVFA